MLDLKAVDRAYIVLVDGAGLTYVVKGIHFLEALASADVYPSQALAEEAKERISAKYRTIYHTYKNYRVVQIKMKIVGP